MMRQKFEEIYRSHAWGGETPSGPGSGKDQAKVLGEELVRLVSSGARSIFDAGCGDHNWLRFVKFPEGASYHGMDISDSAVAASINCAPRGRTFERGDFCRDPLPKVDLILCRDALMHLPLADAQAAIYNFMKSGSRYLLTTHFPMTLDNTEVSPGAWHPINMQLSPFFFKEPIPKIDDWYPNEGYRTVKFLGLWTL